MPFHTRVTELLGIEHPVICGGMTGVGTVEMTAAVSEAGGLGLLTAHNSGSVEQLKKDIERVRTLTKKPFGVNLTILPAIETPDYEGYARTIIDSGVRVVETAGNNPKKWVDMFKQAGCVCIHKCVTIRHAVSAERIGVDIISMVRLIFMLVVRLECSINADQFELRLRPAVIVNNLTRLDFACVLALAKERLQCRLANCPMLSRYCQMLFESVLCACSA